TAFASIFTNASDNEYEKLLNFITDKEIVFNDLNDDDSDLFADDKKSDDSVDNDKNDDTVERYEEFEQLMASQRGRKSKSNSEQLKYRVGAISNDTKIQDIIKMYFYTIGQASILTKKEEIEYAKQIESSDPEESKDAR